jgi:hypothetical protein
MTREQFMQKFNELADKVRADLTEHAERFLKSGALDLEGSEDDYSLVKPALSAALRQEAQRWRPFGGEVTRTEENLMCF